MTQPARPVESQHTSSPKIRIQSAPPVSFKSSPLDIGALASETSSPERDDPACLIPRHTRKRSGTIAYPDVASQQQSPSMAAARMSRHGVDGSIKKHCASPSARKSSKSCAKDVDWADVTDPEERRRIQNRIAQRKFREKARENKEKAERESRNQEHAGNSYRIPLGADINTDHELSGLPWGSMNLGLVVSRGHEAESLRSSGRGTYVGDEPYASPHYTMPLGLPQTASYGSSGGEDVFYDDANYVYDAAVAPAFPPPV